jgi:hypothetical protein
MAATNQQQARIKVQTKVKAGGGLTGNHAQTQR